MKYAEHCKDPIARRLLNRESWEDEIKKIYPKETVHDV